MSIFDVMDSLVPEFTKTDLTVYEFVKKWPDLFANNSISEIVQELAISQSALTRFAKKLGYAGFQEFQYAFRAELNQKSSAGQTLRSDVYGQYLKLTEESVKEEDVKEVAEKILAARIAFFSGFSLSGLPAEYLKTSFDLLGLPAILNTNENWSHAMNGRDVLILFSVASGAAFTYQMQRMSAQADTPYKVLVTMDKKHPLQKYFDKVIVLPGVTAGSSVNKVVPETFGFLLFDDLLLSQIDQYMHTDIKDGKEI